jgi:hypothetical protein
VHWRGSWAFVCYQAKKGSAVVVFDVETCQVLFRQNYQDCDKVQNVIFVPVQDTQELNGYLVLSELKQKKFLKKVHIV